MRKFGEYIISFFAKIFGTNLLGLAYRKRGIGLQNDPRKNGELFFINKVLPKLAKQNQPVFVDAGANKGEYTLLLLQKFPDALIHSFEANPELIPFLRERFQHSNNVTIINNALSSCKMQANLFINKNDRTTGHASLDQTVLKELHNYPQIDKITTETVTLDDYCIANQIMAIDFLKLDIEGHELEALKGATGILKETKVVQLEFNEMNIQAKIFLKDFYELLKDFRFYRIKSDGLYSLGKYSSKNEMFIIQNIVAINKNLKSLH